MKTNNIHFFPMLSEGNGFWLTVDHPDEYSINMVKVLTGMIQTMIKRQEDPEVIIDLAENLKRMQEWINENEMKGPVQE